jgi:hypothetical protein
MPVGTMKTIYRVRVVDTTSDVMLLCNKVLVGRAAGKRRPGILGGWVDSIAMDLQEIEWEGVDWIDVG